MSPLLLPAVLAALAVASAPLDLAPALSGAPATAGARLEAGRHAEALAALGNSRRPEARLLRALALEALARPGEALSMLQGLEEALPELADRIQAARGRLLAAQGRHGEAAAALLPVPAASLLASSASLARARALAADGRPSEALEALGPLLPGPGDAAVPVGAPPALLLAATLRRAASPPDLGGARRALLDCWAGRPASPEAPACLAALRALPGEAGAPPEAAEKVRRGEALLEQGRAVDAVAFLKPLVASLPAPGPEAPLSCRAGAALGRALKRDRQATRAAEVLRPVAERCPESEARTRARYVLASAVAASGGREEAVALYLRFARQQPASPLADDALFNAAEILLRDGRTAEAREALEAVVRDHPAGDRRDEARFKLAWLAWRGGDEAAAVEALRRIEEGTREVDPYEHARAAYWRARLLARQGEAGEAAARAIWSELVALAPADYYALLSRGQLAGEPRVLLPEPESGPGPAGPARRPLDPGLLGDDLHLRAGAALLRVGLPRAAAEELRAVRPPAGVDLESLTCLAALLERAGDHHAAHQLLRAHARAALRRPPEGPLRQVWEVAYPAPHAELVRRWAPAAGLAPELLHALMREESALDPAVVSAAGAIGLTQLMPATARDVARRHKLPPPTRASLTEPATSIRIGSAYLGELLVRYRGSEALALAAYNAGENAVDRWRAAAPQAPLDEFVEEIPYDETRGYVKRVLRSYASYRLLSGASTVRAGAAVAPSGG